MNSLRTIYFSFISLLLINLCKSTFRECFISQQNWLDNQFIPVRQLWVIQINTTSPESTCAVTCMLDEACVSFFFNNQTSVCSGHSIVLADLTHAETQTGSTYYILNCRGERYIGTACTDASNCTTANSRCDGNGFCACEEGNAFWPNNRSCVSNCTSGNYGQEYTAYIDTSIAGNNNADVLNSTIEECQALCAQQTNFVCRTFDFVVPDDRCLMSNITKFTVDPWWYYQPDPNALHYVRDCQ